MSAADDTLRELARALGHDFRDPSLLRQAVTHRSFLNEHGGDGEDHNERLEFLGDAVVELSVSHMLMQRLPDAREGQLSKLRAMVVTESSLARSAASLRLGAHLRLGRGEDSSGGRHKTSILADAFEAVMGALFLDGAFPAADRALRRLMEPLVAAAVEGALDQDHKTRFQELVQRRWRETPTYQVVDERGPDHAKVFRVAVLLGGREVAAAEGPSKKVAEQRAAEQALLHPELLAPDEPPR